MEPHKNKEWFFFSKREILWRMELVQRTRSGSLFTQTETIKMWRWQPQVNQNDLWSTFWAIWKSFGKILAMTNQWRWLWISEVKFKKRLQLTVGLKWTLKILGIVKTPLLEYFLGEGGSKIDFKRRVLQLPKSVSARIQGPIKTARSKFWRVRVRVQVTTWSTLGDQRADRGLDEAGPRGGEDSSHQDAQQQQGAQAGGDLIFRKIDIDLMRIFIGLISAVSSLVTY